MLQIRELTKSYRRRTAVDRLTFDVPEGRVTGFLGPNGAGKSTTMRMILGLVRPDGGRALVHGRPYAELDAPLTRVGALLESAAPHPGRTAYHHLLWVAQSNRIGRGRIREVLADVGLADVAGQRAGGFSLGMTQRLGLATALLGDPPLLVLDEPANGLDPEGARDLRELLRRLAGEGRTVLVSSHLMAEMAQTADHLVVIDRGRLLADLSTAEFVARHARARVRVRAREPERLLQALIAEGIAVTGMADGSLVVEGVGTHRVGAIALARGVTLDELSTLDASLEEAFLRLVGGPR
ncbi:ABC transporter ATP-binding protein [Actinomadura hibisca]|uniref:ABC transporter ATP-binding protein n=1 Tax=Actinomadura hibisca TaxID=68565 RepID=UPI000834A6DA|nr:ATP-binding cassette domain-containing protein [Actinomadura hibisca]